MTGTLRIAIGGTVAAGFLALLAAASASAAVTLGSTPVVGTLLCFPGSGHGMTVMQSTSGPAPGPSYAAATAGVITSWSVRTGTSGPVVLRMKLGRVDAANVVITAVSEREVVSPSALNSFATRIPVDAGWFIGLHYRGGSAIECGDTATGYGFSAGTNADHEPGQTLPFTPANGFVLNVSANLEPDADRDGYGDETQDLCPSDEQTQRACRDRLAPETTITTQPKRKARKKYVKFEFSSSEAGVSFRCSLNGAAFAACASPRSVTAKKGRNVFTVFAKDAAGNADDSPATFSWTFKKRKRRSQR